MPTASLRHLLLLGFAGMAACSNSSSSTPSPNSVAGHVGGMSFSAASAVTETLTESHILVGVDAGAATLGVLIYTTASTCSEFHNANGGRLEIQLPMDVAAGDSYEIVAPPAGLATSRPGTAPTQLDWLDGTCTTAPDEPTGGTVEITSRSGTTLAGTVDAKFADGALTGAFSATLCTSDAGGSTGTCK